MVKNCNVLQILFKDYHSKTKQFFDFIKNVFFKYISETLFIWQQLKINRELFKNTFWGLVINRVLFKNIRQLLVINFEFSFNDFQKVY